MTCSVTSVKMTHPLACARIIILLLFYNKNNNNNNNKIIIIIIIIRPRCRREMTRRERRDDAPVGVRASSKSRGFGRAFDRFDTV